MFRTFNRLGTLLALMYIIRYSITYKIPGFVRYFINHTVLLSLIYGIPVGF